MRIPDRSALTPARIRPEELPAVLAEARAGGPAGEAIVRLSLFAGLTPAETAGLAETGTVREGERWRVTVEGRAPRTITVARVVGAALSALEELRAERGGAGPLIPTVRSTEDVLDRLRAVLTGAEVADPRPFALRAYFAEQLGELALVPTGHLFAYLGSAGADGRGLPEGWDARLADLVDRHLVPRP